MLNTGPAPLNAEGVSTLSQILQEDPPLKYYLTGKACLGILRRSYERGKELPAKLKRALQIQAGVIRPDGKSTDLKAFHINQRDEGIDLHGVSGALMATGNMQMQTFITQPEDMETEGFDGYNGDLTGTVSSTLGVNCGMSTGRNGIIRPISVATEDDSLVCLNDQGGHAMECSENVTGTLRAQEHGHQPLVIDVHGQDGRYKLAGEIAQTVTSSFGEGGGNTPLVLGMSPSEQHESAICIAGNIIDRQPQNGGNGKGYQDDIAYTLTATDHLSGYPDKWSNPED